MLARLDDTIAALASAPGAAMRGVVRLSGPGCRKVLEPCFIADDCTRWTNLRRASRHTGRLLLRHAKCELPVAVQFWPNHRSYTGQPAAEIHTYGSPPLLEAALAELYAHGARPAAAGEFTLRAFLAGRLDLVQAEAVLGVIHAPDDAALRQALSQLAGGISRQLAAIHDQLLSDLADLEAGLDFVDEAIEFVDRPEFIARLKQAGASLQRLLQQAESRMHQSERPRVVLLGPPNAGKSTLFNALAARDAAIVSDEQGTTRDWLSAVVSCNGVEIELIDTAGLDAAADPIATAAQQLREERAARADLILLCRPCDEQDASERFADGADDRSMIVCTKSDLTRQPTSSDALSVSARTGFGLRLLTAQIADRLRLRESTPGELLGSTAARCRENLVQAHAALQRAGALALAGAGDELLAVELRAALEHTGAIAGRVYTDDVLERLFSRFCIGK